VVVVCENGWAYNYDMQSIGCLFRKGTLQGVV
jgi:hypothetical protein